jgi:hypothetical protein
VPLVPRPLQHVETIMTTFSRLRSIVFAVVLYAPVAFAVAEVQPSVTPAEARSIAKDAYIYGFPVVDPTAPKGHEANWVQTVPGKTWNVLLRLYGPVEPWFDKTWKPGEFVAVN